MRFFNRTAKKPLRGPYRSSNIADATGLLRAMRYDENTIRCAQGFNTPTWQNALASVMSAQELERAEKQGAEYVSQFRRESAWAR